ncbi:hypothetical protein HYV49_00590 [Candidatus Pacearchaeota archaeon]|nr:hypothetical protein [Candidatus Pacearchaeota archaeon]
MLNQKRGMSSWIWILIILILVAIGIGIYFLLSGGNDGGILGGNSIPQPPALPAG